MPGPGLLGLTRHNIGMASARDSASAPGDPGTPEPDTLGSFIRMQRQLAQMSLREMATMTAVSNEGLIPEGRDSFGTPTVTINGELSPVNWMTPGALAAAVLDAAGN